jgi:hypothetical protein
LWLASWICLRGPAKDTQHKHIPIRFPSDGGLPFGNQRWQWKNHTISLGISQLATFDDNAGYTIGKSNSIFSFLNGQPLISAPQTKSIYMNQH